MNETPYQRRCLRWPITSSAAKLAAFVGAVMAAALSPGFADAEVAFEEVEGTLLDGTAYLIRKPDDWNGIVISDFDYRTRRNHGVYQHLLAEGYGLSGLTRRDDRGVTLDPADDVRRTMAVLELFRAEFGEPDFVIAKGRSAGGHVARAAAELHPEIIDGAVVLCATTWYLTQNQIFDFFYVLKALLGPEDDTLVTHALPEDNRHIRNRWTEALEAAGQTPEGRARIALAFSLAQYPAFGGSSTRDAGVPKPDFDDADAVADAMAESALNIVNRLSLLRVIDHPPADNPLAVKRPSYVGNDGADYVAYFRNADPDYRQTTETLYRQAGLDLNEEIAMVDNAPRVEMDRKAAGYLLNRRDRTPRGQPQVPMFRMDNAGDHTTTPHMNQHYNDLVERRGLGDLYRAIVVDRGGHCYFTSEEEVATVEVMVNRITTGAWGPTDPEALNALSGSKDFIDYAFTPFAGAWRLDAYSNVFDICPCDCQK